MIKKLLFKLTFEELDTLSKFLIDVSKGILGVPLVVYFLSGFSPLVLFLVFVVDLFIVLLLLALAFKLVRIAKKRKHG